MTAQLSVCLDVLDFSVTLIYNSRLFFFPGCLRPLLPLSVILLSLCGMFVELQWFDRACFLCKLASALFFFGPLFLQTGICSLLFLGSFSMGAYYSVVSHTYIGHHIAALLFTMFLHVSWSVASLCPSISLWQSRLPGLDARLLILVFLFR